eukprot:Gregarina_sp_Poly_1__1076@NODE_1263_length_4573_cov_222_049046_g858_i0_p4_GENE_NODE_1263_length_4573_cov_222_049046_g858_i0NODE_1263_length_4573_cov_222_049046_g858_i0_p4_ORF_typecomplete_len134_score24_96CCDC85/PF10226_9/0_053_NODE_1263_length_4573_cov_222_049046_g858_i021712572
MKREKVRACLVAQCPNDDYYSTPQFQETLDAICMKLEFLSQHHSKLLSANPELEPLLRALEDSESAETVSTNESVEMPNPPKTQSRSINLSGEETCSEASLNSESFALLPERPQRQQWSLLEHICCWPWRRRL